MIWRSNHVAVLVNCLWECIFNTCAFVAVKYQNVQESYPAIPYRTHIRGAQLLTPATSTPMFYHRTRHLYITWAKWGHSTSSHPLASITILILSSHLSPCLPRGHFAAGCPTKPEFLTSNALTCPATPSSYTVPCTEEMST